MSHSDNVLDLTTFRSRRRGRSGFADGGRLDPEDQARTVLRPVPDITVARSGHEPDPWGGPDPAAAVPRPTLRLVPAAGNAASECVSIGSRPVGGGRAAHPVAADRTVGDRSRVLDRDLAGFANAYSDGFAESMEEALQAVDRLTAAFAAAAPCLSPAQHRRLAGTAARRIVAFVDRHGRSGGRSRRQLVRGIVADTVQADRQAFDRGVRGPSPRR